MSKTTTQAHRYGVTDSNSEAYELGYTRGSLTRRSETTDRDLDWLAKETCGRIQTDPQDAVDVDAGMKAGACSD